MNAQELIDTPKPGSQPNATDDLRSLPLPEVEKKLGLISLTAKGKAGPSWTGPCRVSRRSHRTLHIDPT
jgi:hypothetical protein